MNLSGITNYTEGDDQHGRPLLKCNYTASCSIDAPCVQRCK